MTEDLQEQFEAFYAKFTGVSPLKVKFERAFTGGYRDPAITTAWRFYREGSTRRLAA
jgi:hypothetical protein